MSSQGGTHGNFDELVDSGGIGGGGKIDFDFELVELSVSSWDDGGIHICKGNSRTAIVGEPSRHVSPPFDLTIPCTACVGSGSYGRVWLAREKAGGSFVAVKKCRVDLSREKAVREILALQKLRGHKNIVTMIDFKIEKEEDQINKLSIAMEFMKDGNLESYRKSKPNSCLSEKETQLVLLDVAMGMRHMHDNFIIHRDLKPQNLMVELDYKFNIKNVKIADFGTAKVFTKNAGEQHTKKVGTPMYAADEVMTEWGDGKHDTAVDIYSAGVAMLRVGLGSDYDEALNKEAEVPGCIGVFPTTFFSSDHVVRNQTISSFLGKFPDATIVKEMVGLAPEDRGSSSTAALLFPIFDSVKILLYRE